MPENKSDPLRSVPGKRRCGEKATGGGPSGKAAADVMRQRERGRRVRGKRGVPRTASRDLAGPRD